MQHKQQNGHWKYKKSITTTDKCFLSAAATIIYVLRRKTVSWVMFKSRDLKRHPLSDYLFTLHLLTFTLYGYNNFSTSFERYLLHDTSEFSVFPFMFSYAQTNNMHNYGVVGSWKPTYCTCRSTKEADKLYRFLIQTT